LFLLLHGARVGVHSVASSGAPSSAATHVYTLVQQITRSLKGLQVRMQ
jgi:hypothetical protein